MNDFHDIRLPEAWHRCALWMLCAVAVSSSAVAQTSSLSGTIRDGRTHEPLESAVVTLEEAHMHSATDRLGVFRFLLPSAMRVTLSVQRIGYAVYECVIDGQDLRAPLAIELEPAPVQSDAVIIRSTPLHGASGHGIFPSSVRTGEELASRSLVGASDALAELPGISLVRDGAWETAVSIRGMSRSNIVMMVDRTRIETANDIAGALSLVDLQEVERIEAVRSPGSSLWGSSALAAVHMMTKQPSFSDESEWHLRIDEEAGSVNGLLSHHAALEHSSPVFGMRASGGYRSAADLETPEGVMPDSRFTDFHLGCSAALKTYGAQTLLARYQRSQAEDTGIPGGAPIASTAGARYTLARRELASLEYAMPDVSRMIESFSVRCASQHIARNVEIRQTPSLTLTPHVVHRMMSAQMESRIRMASDLSFTTGVDFWKRRLDSRRERVNRATGETISERPLPLSSFLDGGVFLHSVWTAVPERLTLEFGARHDWIRVTSDQPVKADNRSWSASAGAALDLLPGIECSVLLSAAFRSPSLEERFQYLDLGSFIRLGDPALKPEQSRAIDLGIQVRSGHRGRLRIDYFHHAMTDLVADVPGTVEGRPAFIKSNIGRAIITGFDCAAGFALSEHAGMHGTLSYVYGEDTRMHAALPQIAPLSGTIGMDAAHASLGTASVDLSYALMQHRTAPGEMTTPGFAVVSLSGTSLPLRLPLGSDRSMEVTVRAGIVNLFNASYRLHLSTLRGLVKSEPGRNVYGSLSFVL
ncbi:MAG: TonB-dependent receptor domain-containing protein [Acidobacteriota bacterium]